MKKVDLLNDDIKHLVHRYMIPSVLGMLALSTCIFFDTMFIGKGIGDNGLAALNICLPIYSIFNAISYLIAIGGATTLSIALGRKEFDRANSIFSLSLVLVGILSFIFTVLGLMFLEEICLIIGASTNILNLTKDYMGIVLAGTGLFMFSSTLGVFLRNDKAPKITMIAVITGNLVNIILDYIFVINFGFGMKGAAVATVIAQFCAIFIMLIHFFRGNNSIKLNFKNLNFKETFKILKNGSSNFLMDLSAAFVIYMFNIMLFSIKGDMGVAAYGIINNITLIGLAVINGIAQSVQPIWSINYGAKNLKRVRESLNIAIKISLITGIVFLIIGFIMPGRLASIFTNDNGELLRLTIKGIRISFFSFLFVGCNMVSIFYFQSIESTKSSSIISLMRGFILLVAFIIILPKFFGINGVWITIPLTEAITFIIAWVLFRKNKILI